MPITQARMLAILAEAEGASQAFTELRVSIAEALARWPDAKQARVVIEALVEQMHAPTMTACQIERRHFDRVSRKNDKNARYMQGKRDQSTSQQASIDAGIDKAGEQK